MRVMVLSLKNQPVAQNRTDDTTSISISLMPMLPNGRGLTVALAPSTRKILNKLLPITLPMAIPRFFFTAATTDVANSGNDVPPATNVSPMTDSLTPNERAIPLAQSTNNCPPKISPASPNTINSSDFQIGINLICSPDSSPLLLAIEKV